MLIPKRALKVPCYPIAVLEKSTISIESSKDVKGIPIINTVFTTYILLPYRP